MDLDMLQLKAVLEVEGVNQEAAINAFIKVQAGHKRKENDHSSKRKTVEAKVNLSLKEILMADYHLIELIFDIR
jgi:hypothetical protein